MSKIHLAYFSPLPPDWSGIADYSRELLPELTRLVDVTLFTPEPDKVSANVRGKYPIQALGSYPAQRFDYHLPLYQMGNNMEHEALYKMMCRFPGVMVLHDYMLNHFTATLTAGRGDFLGYMRQLGYVRGIAGINQLRDHALRSRGMRVPVIAEAGYFPLESISFAERLLDLNLGVIVHSDYARKRLQAWRSDRPIKTIPAQIQPYSAQARRSELPWSGQTIVFASVGHITADKRLDRALDAFARLHTQLAEVRYLLVGQVFPDVDLDHMLQSRMLAELVHYAGFASDLEALVAWLATADVVVNLRDPTMGETSAVALRSLAAGKPLIVYDHGWYRELPDTVALKVPPGDERALLTAMRRLAQDQDLRLQMGAAGQAYVQAHHHPRQVAAAYASFLEQIVPSS